MYENLFYQNQFSGEKYPQSLYHSQPSAQMKAVGNKTILRLDAVPKVTGKTRFAADIMMPGKLFLKFAVCPYSHAKITTIDTSKAKALPGVVMVLTHADVPDLVDTAPYEFVLDDECWHDGDEFAAVVAEEEDIAENAISLLDVKWQVLPFVLFPEDALKSGAPILHGDTNISGTNKFDRGNVDTGFTQSDIVVGPLTYGATQPTWTEDCDTADFEGDSHTAYWDGERVVVYTYEKGRYAPHRTIAAALKLPFNSVSVPPCAAGAIQGGNRGGNYKGGILAAYVSKKLGRPVVNRYDMFQQIAGKGNQKTTRLTMKAGIKKDGSLVSFSMSNLFDIGCLGGSGANGQDVVRQMFNVPNLHSDGQTVVTNTPPNGSIRCVAHPRPIMQVMMFMDKVAEASGLNPADFYLKNVLTTSGPGGDLDDPKTDTASNAMPSMLNQLIEISGWRSKWKGWKTPMSVNGSKQRGIGIGLNRCDHGSLSNPISASIRVTPEAQIVVTCGSQDTGQGWRTAAQVIAAEELGVPVSSVTTLWCFTDRDQESRAPSGSTITRGSGTGVIVAARDAKLGIFTAAVASKLIKGATKPEDLEMTDGSIYLKSDPTQKVALVDVVKNQDSLVGPIIGRGYYATLSSGRLTRQWGACAAEVEVDVDTGEAQVINIWTVTDAGRVIWYKGAVAQALGSIEMGTSRLFDALVKDSATGATLNANLLDYKINTHMDSPNSTLAFNESIDPYGPFGAKGISEPGFTPVPPAVGNAIYNACGARLMSSPFSPDKILAAIGKV